MMLIKWQIFLYGCYAIALLYLNILTSSQNFKKPIFKKCSFNTKEEENDVNVTDSRKLASDNTLSRQYKLQEFYVMFRFGTEDA